MTMLKTIRLARSWRPLSFSTLAGIALPFLAGCVTELKPLFLAKPTNAVTFEIPATDDGLPGSGPLRRADWFRKVWSERRQSFATTAAQDTGSLVFLGDSITQGWGERLATALPTVHLSNRGIDGDTSRGVLVRLSEDVLPLKPRGVVLLIGTNDLEEEATPEVIAGNVRLIVDALRKADRTMPVFLCAVFPSSTSKKRPSDKIQRLNELYRDLVRERRQVTYLDTWTLFADAKGDAKPEEFPDLLHPNTAGYAKWAAALRPLLATHGFVDTELDPFTPEPGYISLFNGRDLSGWRYLPLTAKEIETAQAQLKANPALPAPATIVKPIDFDGKTASGDGRFLARHSKLIVATPSEYRRVQKIWTRREFPRNFILKLEFRATPNADSGIYLRGPQLQCRDYLLAGPYKSLKRYKPQEWNEIVVTVRDNVASCTCNGELLVSDLKLPATGPIGLEGDRGQMEYRRIRFTEQP